MSTTPSNIGKRVIATSRSGSSRIVGKVTGETFWGGTSIVALDIDGTTSSIHLDYDEWRWREHPKPYITQSETTGQEA